MPNPPRPRVPLVVPFEARGYVDTRIDPKVINGLAEKTDSGEFQVYKRPGTALHSTLGTNIGPLPGNLLSAGQYSYLEFGVGVPMAFYKSASGNSVYLAYNGSVLNTYQGGGGAGRTLITAINFAQTNVFVNTLGSNVTGPGGSVFTLAPFQFGPIHGPSVADIAPGVPGVAFLDGELYIMDSRALVWGSVDGITWPIDDVAACNKEPGNGIYLAKQGDVIVAFKEYSTEFLYDAGNTLGSALSQMPGTAVQWGCVDAFTVQDIEGSLFWLATSRQSAFFVAEMTAGKVSKISTSSVDRLIDDVKGPFYSFSFKDFGHNFYGITAAGTNLTLVYDLTVRLWYLWTSASGDYWPYWGMITLDNGERIAQHVSTTSTYSVDADFGTDLGVLVPLEVYTGEFDGGNRLKKVNSRLDVICDQRGGLLQIRHSDDDYRTWSTFRTVNMDHERPNLKHCGTFRHRGVACAVSFRQAPTD